MGNERSGRCRRYYSLPAMRVVEHRVSANDAEVPDSGVGRAPLRDENHPQGILLPGLSLHLEQRGRAHHRPALAPVLSGPRGSNLIFSARGWKLAATRAKLSPALFNP